MDRSLKARLIGASVLVLLVVLVVPELLSGRREAAQVPAPAEAGKGPTRTYTIELGKGATPVAADAVVPRPVTPSDSPLARETPARPEPAPATGKDDGASVPRTDVAAKVAEPASAPQPARAEPAPAVRVPTSPPRQPPVTAAVPTRGTWSVQVGAFGSADSARKLVRSLEADGFDAYVSTVQREGKTLHRVRVGPESAQAAADALAGRLKARGLPVSLVAND